jgi:hypothetical protein
VPQNIENPSIYNRIDRVDSPVEGSSTRYAPPVRNPENGDWVTSRTDQSPQYDSIAADPVRRVWSYSPVKQASYVSLADEDKNEATELVTYRGTLTRVTEADPEQQPEPTRKVNVGWESIDW